MSSPYLTQTEIQELTGWKQPHKCNEWLEFNHYLFDVSSKGWAVVLWSHVNARLGGVTSLTVEPELRLK